MWVIFYYFIIFSNYSVLAQLGFSLAWLELGWAVTTTGVVQQRELFNEEILRNKNFKHSTNSAEPANNEKLANHQIDENCETTPIRNSVNLPEFLKEKIQPPTLWCHKDTGPSTDDEVCKPLVAILPTNDVGKVCSVGQAPDVHPQNIHAVGDAFAVDSFSEKLETVSPIQATKVLDIPSAEHHPD